MALAAGDLFAIGSSLGFAASNVLVAQGTRRAGDDNGAFLSLLVTTGIAGALWLGLGLARGFEPVEAGTRMHWLFDLHPHGVLRALRPVVQALGRRQERRNWAALRDYLEAAP